LKKLQNGTGLPATKPGLTYGATDELGFNAVENPVPVHDFQATLLHLLGIDHTRLTYRFQGRDFRLTDVEGDQGADCVTGWLLTANTFSGRNDRFFTWELFGWDNSATFGPGVVQSRHFFNPFRISCGEIVELCPICLQIVKLPGLFVAAHKFPLAPSNGAVTFVLPENRFGLRSALSFEQR
jgi:hypothetical protein